MSRSSTPENPSIDAPLVPRCDAKTTSQPETFSASSRKDVLEGSPVRPNKIANWVSVILGGTGAFIIVVLSALIGLRNRSFYSIYESLYRVLMTRLFRQPVPAKIPQETRLESSVDQVLSVAGQEAAAILEKDSVLAEEIAHARAPLATVAVNLVDAVLDEITDDSLEKSKCE